MIEKEKPGAEESTRPRLGRGLAALIADSSAQMPGVSPGAGERRRLAVEHIRPNPRNPRRHFAPEDLDELAHSIGEKGVLQPILVRPVPFDDERFEIIAGERRWRAAKVAGLGDVPVIVVEASDKEALEIAIIENVQRADLNAIEEARGYERLAHEFGYSQTDLARTIGRSRSHVANTLRLLKLPHSVETLVVEGAITAGHARALLAFDDPESVARRIVAKGLNVRDVERLAQARSGVAVARPRRSVAHMDTKTVSERLAGALGLEVEIRSTARGGELRIRYGSPEELERLCRSLVR